MHALVNKIQTEKYSEVKVVEIYNMETPKNQRFLLRTLGNRLIDLSERVL